MKEAQYNCCWNANYCNEACQQAHWPEHMKHCVQVHQSQSTPAPDPTPTPQPLPPSSATISVATPTDTQPFFPPPRPSSTGSHIVMPQAAPAPMATQQSPREMGGATETLPQYADSAHADPRSEHPAVDKAMTRIEQVPNHTSLLSHQASQHMKNLLLQQAAVGAQQHSQQHSLQHHQQPATPQQTSLPPRASQHNAKNSVISGIRHSPSVSLYQPLVAQVVDGTGSGVARDSSLPAGVPPPASPGSPASEHSSVHNPPGFSWPYQQPVIISSTDGYPMPLLPTLQSSGNQQQPQHQPYFKAF